MVPTTALPARKPNSPQRWQTGLAMSRPFAAFDIDGTVIRWQLYHAIADELAKQGHLDPVEYKKVEAARMVWKARAEKDSFAAYEEELVKLVNSSITGISVEAAKQAYSSV